MFSASFKAWMRRLMQGVVVPTFGRLGLTPNMLTLIGLLLTAGVALVLANGQFVLGGVLMLLAGLFDMFDGALARALNQQSRFGAFLDSTVDRFCEAVVFLGLLIFYELSGSRADHMQTVLLIYAAIVGSLMVSYTRARAEALGFKCEVGLLGRPERIILLAAGLILGWLLPVLWILAVFTNVTAFHRVGYVWYQELAQARKDQPKPRKRPAWLAWFK